MPVLWRSGGLVLNDGFEGEIDGGVLVDELPACKAVEESSDDPLRLLRLTVLCCALGCGLGAVKCELPGIKFWMSFFTVNQSQ
ncbi:hypothetical protein D3C85_1327410 [compost metagenome]